MTVISTPYFRSKIRRDNRPSEYGVQRAYYNVLLPSLCAPEWPVYRHTWPITNWPTNSEREIAHWSRRPAEGFQGTDFVCRSTTHLYVCRAQTSAQTGCLFFFWPIISHSAAPLCKYSLVASRCLLSFNV